MDRRPSEPTLVRPAVGCYLRGRRWSDGRAALSADLDFGARGLPPKEGMTPAEMREALVEESRWWASQAIPRGRKPVDGSASSSNFPKTITCFLAHTTMRTSTTEGTGSVGHGVEHVLQDPAESWLCSLRSRSVATGAASEADGIALSGPPREDREDRIDRVRVL